MMRSMIMALNRGIQATKERPAVAAVLDKVPPSAKARMRSVLYSLSKPSVMSSLHTQANQTNTILARMLYEQAQRSPRFAEAGRLLSHGFKVYSQHDEDGIFEEIFRRVGTTDRTFIEFGVGDGYENCSLYPLLLNWSGAWIDASALCCQESRRRLDFLIQENRLKIKHDFVTMENIEKLFAELGVAHEADFLSIDIDSNDYWIWQAIRSYRPRVVAIEYNASFGPTAPVTIPYNGRRMWDLSNYYGASLKALEILGREKGYSLVGCNYTGVTAFFVREDLIRPGLFLEPFTAENHWEPARYFVKMPNGHAAAYGPLVNVGPARGLK